MLQDAQSGGWSPWRPSLTLRLALLGGAFVVVVVACLTWVYLQSQQALVRTVAQDGAVRDQIGKIERHARELRTGIAQVRAQVQTASERAQAMSAQLSELDRQRAALVRLDDAVALQWTTAEALNRLHAMMGAHAGWIVAPSPQSAAAAHAAQAQLHEMLVLLERMEAIAPGTLAAIVQSVDEISRTAAAAATSDPSEATSSIASVYALSQAPIDALRSARAAAEASLMREKGMALSIAEFASVRTQALLRETDSAREGATRAGATLEALKTQQASFLDSALEQNAHREQLKSLLHGIGVKTLVALVVGTVLAVVLWLAVMRVVLRPLRELVSAMSRVGHHGGVFSERLNVTNDNLLGRLAASFNTMLETLSRSTVSTRFLNGVLDSMNEMLVVLDAERRVVHVNRAFCCASGRDAAVLVGLPIDDLLRDGADDGRAHKLLAREHDVDMPIAVRISEIEQVEGSPGRFVLVASDIGEQLAAEAALTASQRRFNDFADSAADWFWEMDADLRFSYFADRFEQVTGVKPEVLLGKTRQETGIPDVDPQAWAEHLQALDERRSFRDFVHPRVLESGETVWLSINGRPVFDDDGVFVGYRGTGSDVTERIKAIEAVRAAKEAADETVRAKTNFLANVSHEIRTPINGVIGLTDLLLRSELDPRQQRHARALLNSGQALLRQVNDLLDFARLESGKLQLEDIAFSPEELIDEVRASHIELAAAHELRLTSECHSSAGRLRGDPYRLRQVLSNLLSNALKFTHEGGIHIKLTSTPSASNQAVLLCEVSDTGIGIAAERIDSVFDAFTQADGSTTRQFGGTGLGLSICRELVERMGGEVGADSVLGEGSRFWFRLNCDIAVQQDPQVLRLPTAPAKPSWTRVPQILVIDDNEINRIVAQELLWDLGCEAEACESGERALELVQHTAFDLIFMDCQMPGLDGYQTARLMREQQQACGLARTPIVALTANALDADEARCLAAGMDAFVTKPVNSDDLLTVLHRWLDLSAGPRSALAG